MLLVWITYQWSMTYMDRLPTIHDLHGESLQWVRACHIQPSYNVAPVPFSLPAYVPYNSSIQLQSDVFHWISPNIAWESYSNLLVVSSTILCHCQLNWFHSFCQAVLTMGKWSVGQAHIWIWCLPSVDLWPLDLWHLSYPYPAWINIIRTWWAVPSGERGWTASPCPLVLYPPVMLCSLCSTNPNPKHCSDTPPQHLLRWRLKVTTFHLHLVEMGTEEEPHSHVPPQQWLRQAPKWSTVVIPHLNAYWDGDWK